MSIEVRAKNTSHEIIDVISWRSPEMNCRVALYYLNSDMSSLSSSPFEKGIIRSMSVNLV
jgi:hypothetical protein